MEKCFSYGVRNPRHDVQREKQSVKLHGVLQFIYKKKKYTCTLMFDYV